MAVTFHESQLTGILPLETKRSLELRSGPKIGGQRVIPELQLPHPFLSRPSLSPASDQATQGALSWLGMVSHFAATRGDSAAQKQEARPHAGPLRLPGPGSCRPSVHAPKRGGPSARARDGRSHRPGRGWRSELTGGRARYAPACPPPAPRPAGFSAPLPQVRRSEAPQAQGGRVPSCWAVPTPRRVGRWEEHRRGCREGPVYQGFHLLPRCDYP